MRISEPLNNGLVTARDPALLNEGELQRADNTIYLPSDPSLHAAPGETAAAISLGGAVTGLVHTAFDYVQADCDITQGSATVTVTPIVVNGVTTALGSSIVRAPSTNNFVGIYIGATVTGTNIPAGTTVSAWTSPTELDLSAAATGGGSSNLTFTNTRFSNVTAGARVAGNGIPNGATVASVAANGTSFTLATGYEATVTGLAKVIVDSDNLVIAQVNGQYKKSKVSGDGTSLSFTTLESGVAEGDHLEQVHYNNIHVLLNGKHENRVVRADGVIRAHGMAPVTISCDPTVVSGAGYLWALKSGTGFYAYWTTEYDANNDLESDFNLGTDSDGKPIKPPLAQITDVLTQAVQITRPPRVNATATHWRVYRSIKYASTTLKSAQRENRYPDGYLVAQIELRDDNQQQSFIDGGGLTSTSAVYATYSETSTGTDGLQWADIAKAQGAPDNPGPTDDSNSATLTGIDKGWVPVRLRLGDFAIPSVSAPITGITVTVTGRKIGAGSLAVALRSGSKTTDLSPFTIGLGLPIGFGGSKTVPLTTSNTTHTVGGFSDKWNKNWDPSDFADGKFFVELLGVVNYTGDKVAVDAVSVVVSYGETQEESGSEFLGTNTDAYPAIVVSPFGFNISAGRGGQPPKASTGDIFQDSLVINDVNDASLVRYSFPSLIDAFPAPYFLNFDTKDQDKVTIIRTVGNVMVVGLQHQLYRVNYLPRDTDAEFDRGRAVELIERGHGIAGTKAGIVFTLPGFGQVLAYANASGVFMTDGYRVKPLTLDLDWWNTVDITRLSQCHFVNNAELHALEFYYVPIDAAITAYPTKQLYFHYHPTHLKGDPRSPMLKVSGPRATAANSSGSVTLSDGTQKVYIGTPTAFVAYIDRLKSSLASINISTRLLTPFGLGGEWRLSEGLLGYTVRDYFTAASGKQLSLTATVTKRGAADRTTSAKTIAIPTLSGSGSTNPKMRRTDAVIIPDSGISMAFNITAAGTSLPRLSLEHLTFDAEGQGLDTPT